MMNDRSGMTSLKNDNITRWNSTLTMLDSFLKNKTIIELILQRLRKYELILEDDELEKCEEMVSILRIFAKATDFLQGQRYPTMNMVLIILADIEKSLKECHSQSSSNFEQKISKILLGGFEKRFSANDFMVVAAFLDPSMKKLPIIIKHLEENETTIVDMLKNFQNKFKLAPTLLQPITPATTATTNETHSPIKRMRLELLQRHNDSENVQPSLDVEVAKYNLKEGELVVDPIVWWQQNGQQFPQLQKLANIFLSVPATSAPSERAFSSAGLLLTVKRSRLHPVRAKQILFVHDNFDVLIKK